MLTMPKLIAAVIVALIAWIVTGQVKVEMLEVHGSYNFGWFVPLAVLMGFLSGWVVLGSRANGRLGFGIATSVGITAVAVAVFWVVLLVTGNEMLRLAVARRYGGPVEALQAMVPIGADYGQYLLRAHIIVTLLVGGMAAGLIADWSARRWK